MKIYSCSVPTDQVSSYLNRDWQKEEEENLLANMEAARALGYTGKLTGKVVRDGVADGYACYMVMQAPSGAISLMSMDWCDGYQSPWAHRWTKKDVLGMITRQDARAKLFGGRAV